MLYKSLVIMKDNRCVGAARNTPSGERLVPLSTNQGSLNADLIKIRSFGPLLKDPTKPHKKVKYSDLSTMHDARGVSCPVIV